MLTTPRCNQSETKCAYEHHPHREQQWVGTHHEELWWIIAAALLLFPLSLSHTHTHTHTHSHTRVWWAVQWTFLSAGFPSPSALSRHTPQSADSNTLMSVSRLPSLCFPQQTSYKLRVVINMCSRAPVMHLILCSNTWYQNCGKLQVVLRVEYLWVWSFFSLFSVWRHQSSVGVL